MKVVSNSGPLINLAKVGRFALLQNLFQNITIPPEVFAEVVVQSFLRTSSVPGERGGNPEVEQISTGL